MHHITEPNVFFPLDPDDQQLNPGHVARVNAYTVFPITDPDLDEGDLDPTRFISAVGLVLPSVNGSGPWVVFCMDGMLCATPIGERPDSMNFNYYMADLLQNADLATYNPTTELYEVETAVGSHQIHFHKEGE